MNHPAPLLIRQIQSIKKHLNAGDLQSAGRQCEQAVQAFPQHPEGWSIFSEVWLRIGHTEHAYKCAERAVELGPDTIHYSTQLARCLSIHGDHARAKEVAKSASTGSDASPRELVNLGNVLGMAGDHENALLCFRRAAELDPDNPTVLYNLATSLRLHGETEAAEATYDRIIELRPSDYEAWHSRSLLRRQTRDRNHVDSLRQALDKTADDAARAHLYYAMAKELEDLGETDQAFRAYQEGAERRDRQLDFDVAPEVSGMEAMQSAYPAARLAAAESLPPKSDDPIFIVGLPRSGTTLLEQILSAHSDVIAAGELPDFPVALYAAAGINPRRADALTLLAASSERLDEADPGRRYLHGVHRRFGSGLRIIDKLPSNFLYLGPLALALPGARVILMERHPMDSCLAMFRTMFRHGYPWSYNLEKIGRYYCAYHRLTRHWLDVLPSERIIRVSYESLVDRPQPVVADILKQLDLDWQDACMAFHRQERAVATPSASQVREPIYRTSTGRWKQHARALEPLRGKLRAGGIDV